MLFVTWRERVSVKWNRIWLASSKWMKSTWINWNLEHFATAVVKFRANVATFNRKQQITSSFFFLKINFRAAFFFFSHFCFFDPGRWKRNCFDLQRGICGKMGNVSPPKRRQKFQVKKIQRGRQWRRNLCQYCDRLEQSWIFQLLKPKITFLLAINRANVQRARPRGKLTMN